MLAEILNGRFNTSPAGEPVAAALRARDLTRMRALLDAEPQLVGKGDKGSSQPIHWATMTRQIEAIDELVRRGADINARRMDGARPIHVTNGDYFYRGWRDVPGTWPVTPAQVMTHLVSRGAVIDLPTASHIGDIDRVRELLRQDPSLANKAGDHEGYYLGAGAPLANAAATGRMDILQLLLEHGADPNLREEQYAPRGRALYSAVYNGHYEIAKLLLERGAFPNPEVESSGDALWVSREWRPDKRMEQLLLSHGAKAPEPRPAEDWPTRRRELAAHHAAPRGGSSRRRDAGEEAARRRRRISRRETSTFVQRRSRGLRSLGQLEMARFLLKRGVPRSLPDDPPWTTPIEWAKRRGHEQIAELLL